MIDLSDGLGRDGGRIADASRVRIELQAGQIPLHGDAEGWAAAAGEGEDYELLFTVRDGGRLPEQIPETGAPITRIGTVKSGSGCVIMDEVGAEFDARELGLGSQDMTDHGFTQFVARGESQTVDFGRRLAAILRPGDVVALVGELGAGKTRMVRGLAEGLGIAPDRAHSPTYVVANVYEGSGGVRLAHVDAYRLAGAGDLDELGWDRLDDGASIVVVEWADRLGGAIAEVGRTFHILIEHLGPDERRISLTAPEGREHDCVHFGA